VAAFSDKGHGESAMTSGDKSRGQRRGGRPSRTASVNTSQIQSSLQFLDGVHRSLPVIVGPTHLASLNLALGSLFDLLREARRLFDEQGDDGRLGAFIALTAFWTFILLFEAPSAEGLALPILRLQDALDSLDKNFVAPIVKPIRRGGRAPSSLSYGVLKGCAAGTVKLLVQNGLARQEVCKSVARMLDQLGLRSERGAGHITATTVRNWYNEISSDSGGRGTAAIAYNWMVTRNEQLFSAMPKDQARRFALNVLGISIRSFFPGIKQTA
jgi:hypothetical protein